MEPGLLEVAVGAAVVLFLTFGAVESQQHPEGEPLGSISLVDVTVNKSLLSPRGGLARVDFYLTCSTQSAAGRVQLEEIEELGKKVSYPEGKDARIDMLPFETIECELKESLNGSTQTLSHGFCDYPYKRFLVNNNNTVHCQLRDGSQFKLRMECDGGCPRIGRSPRTTPYCSGLITLPPANFGIQNSFGDGSPGFGMYAPNTTCSWRIPRSTKGNTNFLFTRFDLAGGDAVTVYGSHDGTTRNLIRKYVETSTPESVSSDEPFMIIEFTSDDEEEGLGFYGFYYDSIESTQGASLIIPSSEGEVDGNNGEGPAVAGISLKKDPNEDTFDEPEGETGGISLTRDTTDSTPSASGGVSLTKTPETVVSTPVVEGAVEIEEDGSSEPESEDVPTKAEGCMGRNSTGEGEITTVKQNSTANCTGSSEEQTVGVTNKNTTELQASEGRNLTAFSPETRLDATTDAALILKKNAPGEKVITAMQEVATAFFRPNVTIVNETGTVVVDDERSDESPVVGKEDANSTSNGTVVCLRSLFNEDGNEGDGCVTIGAQKNQTEETTTEAAGGEGKDLSGVKKTTPAVENDDVMESNEAKKKKSDKKKGTSSMRGTKMILPTQENKDTKAETDESSGSS